MFDPKGAVLIESGDAILGLDVFAAGLVRHFLDKGNNRLFRRPIVPGRKRGSLSVGLLSQPQCQKHDGGESARQPGDLQIKVHMGALTDVVD